jgi:predicted ATPase
LVIISGEVGVGKSHLALALADQTVQQSSLVLTGHCYEFEGTLSYQALVEMLRSAAALIRYVHLVLLHRAALARLVPEMVEEVDYSITLPDDVRAQLFEAALTRSES